MADNPPYSGKRLLPYRDKQSPPLFKAPDPSRLVAPINLAPPSIAGTPQVGQTLTRVSGAWANSPTSFAHQWFANGVAIPGATGSTYVPTSADVGKTITLTTTATNAVGSASATSAATTAVIAAAAAGAAPGTISSDFSDPNTILPRV